MTKYEYKSNVFLVNNFKMMTIIFYVIRKSYNTSLEKEPTHSAGKGIEAKLVEGPYVLIEIIVSKFVYGE